MYAAVNGSILGIAGCDVWHGAGGEGRDQACLVVVISCAQRAPENGKALREDFPKKRAGHIWAAHEAE